MLTGVEGWLYIEEAVELYETVRSHPAADPVLVVEIGSWKGRSTIALAQAVRDRGHPLGRVVAIDPHTGSREHHERFGAVDTFDEFLRNIDRAGLTDLVEPMRTTSLDASGQLVGSSVDVLFIDGSHEYEDVRYR